MTGSTPLRATGEGVGEMREEIGDLFAHPARAIVIPVNWVTKRNGEAVMGAGVARQAAARWPWLPSNLGKRINATPNDPGLFWMGTVGVDTVSFPTKRHWRERADIGLIEQGARDLVVMANRHGWQTIVLPRLGCGLGQLDWADVRAVLAPILDGRFVVVSR